VVFASHKGGVGRSTALAVTAAALSREGYNLIVIDLDLEAPGLGEMLLKELPSYGTLDFFVEAGVQDIDDDFLDNLVVPSPLADRGLVHVARSKFACLPPREGKLGQAEEPN
jgi:cellulose biosynthesis protein BcsQ